MKQVLLLYSGLFFSFNYALAKDLAFVLVHNLVLEHQVISTLKRENADLLNFSLT